MLFPDTEKVYDNVEVASVPSDEDEVFKSSVNGQNFRTVSW